jgi:hypothetical protein
MATSLVALHSGRKHVVLSPTLQARLDSNRALVVLQGTRLCLQAPPAEDTVPSSEIAQERL